MKTISVLVILAAAVALNSAISFCPQLLQCYQNAEQQQKLCDNLEKSSAVNNNKVNNNQANADPCKTALHDYGEQLKVKQLAHEMMVMQCLQKYAPQGMDLDPKKATECQAKPQQLMAVSAAEFQGPLPNPNGSKADHDALNKMKQDCGKQVHNMREQCNSLRGCCFEVEICEQEYELTDLHDDVHRLQLEIADKKRDCHH